MCVFFLISDLLWSDPIEDEEAEDLDEDDLKEWQQIEFKPNRARGCSVVYGYKVFFSKKKFKIFIY
jgi:hypothetical protein